MSQLVAVREFSTVAEMMAHYKAVRSRTWPKAAPAVKAAEPVAPAPVKRVKPAVRKQRHYPRIETRTDQVRHIMAAVAAHYDVEPCHLWGPSQVTHVAHIRRVAMYLTREFSDLGLKQIGNRFNRHHTVVLAGVRRIAVKMRTDAELRQIVEDLTGQLKEIESANVAEPN